MHGVNSKLYKLVGLTLLIQPLNAGFDVFDETHVFLHCVLDRVDVWHGQKALVCHEGGHMWGASSQHSYNIKVKVQLDECIFSPDKYNLLFLTKYIMGITSLHRMYHLQCATKQ